MTSCCSLCAGVQDVPTGKMKGAATCDCVFCSHDVSEPATDISQSVWKREDKPPTRNKGTNMRDKALGNTLQPQPACIGRSSSTARARHKSDLDLFENSLEVAHLTSGNHGNGCASLASTPCPTTPANTAQLSHTSSLRVTRIEHFTYVTLLTERL